MAKQKSTKSKPTRKTAKKPAPKRSAKATKAVKRTRAAKKPARKLAKKAPAKSRAKKSTPATLPMNVIIQKGATVEVRGPGATYHPDLLVKNSELRQRLGVFDYVMSTVEQIRVIGGPQPADDIPGGTTLVQFSFESAEKAAAAFDRAFGGEEPGDDTIFPCDGETVWRSDELDALGGEPGAREKPAKVEVPPAALAAQDGHAPVRNDLPADEPPPRVEAADAQPRAVQHDDDHGGTPHDDLPADKAPDADPPPATDEHTGFGV